ncbi:MAG: chorismate synthase [Lachnospiraceae bacterium]|nr:chorismate synthase [Lachnospiraceae bacterium]
MPGSTFGKYFRVTTWGESHGPALGCVVDGCPAGLPLSEADLQPYLDRRKPGTSAVTTSRKEEDLVEILSGVFEGKTTGAPISLMIRNTSQRSGDYGNLADTYRPGHADYTFDRKYGIRDYRGGGRSSGRETAARVAAGAIAMQLLNTLGISLYAGTVAIGPVRMSAEKLAACRREDFIRARENAVVMPDAEMAKEAAAYIETCRMQRDSAGGIVECRIDGVPAGLGETVFDKLDALLGQALFSIGAVKAVEIGDGVQVVGQKGSENNDPIRRKDGKTVFDSNHAGGILGGMSNGDRIVVKAHFKPTPSIYQPQDTIKKDGSETVLEIVGRHDPVVAPRAVVVVEAMCALTLADLLLANMGARIEYLRKIYADA